METKITTVKIEQMIKEEEIEDEQIDFEGVWNYNELKKESGELEYVKEEKLEEDEGLQKESEELENVMEEKLEEDEEDDGIANVGDVNTEKEKKVCPGDEVKKKSQNLRDTCRKEFSNLNSSNCGDGAPEKKRGKYHHNTRSTICSLDIPTLPSHPLPLDMSSPSPTFSSPSLHKNIPEFSTSYQSKSPSLPGISKLKTKTTQKEEAILKLLRIEEEKMREIKKMTEKKEECEKGEDYHFLMSLLPYMRKLPILKKMKLRYTIQAKLLSALEEIENLESSN